MAGAGYKLFATGDVLTAAEVNTYLQQQVTMVFADSSARTTALSAVLAEGMMSYLQDTNTVEVYNGSNWVNVGNTGDVTEVQAGTGISVADGTGPIPIVTNTMATEIDAKGDLIVGTGSDAFDRLAVGNDGESIVADSSATTGLRWQGNFAAGKNKIINGDMFINQRNTTSTTTSTTFLVDRFRIFLAANAGSVTGSIEQFTPGSAPVAGYEAKQYLQVVTVGQAASTDRAMINYPGIEDVRTFAGQTMTVSFWAKAASGTPNVSVEVTQSFGSGGSPSLGVVLVDKKAISSSWARYSYTFNVGSLAGKTIGTDANSSFLGLNIWFSAGSTFDSRTNTLGLQNNTFQIWGVQVEAGSVATAFQTATGTLAGELAACQRYYYRNLIGASAQAYGSGFADSTTGAHIFVPFPVQMRVRPTALEQTGTAADYQIRRQGAGITACSAVPQFISGSAIGSQVVLTVASGLTAGEGLMGRSASSDSYLGWSAEL